MVTFSFFFKLKQSFILKHLLIKEESDVIICIRNVFIDFSQVFSDIENLNF